MTLTRDHVTFRGADDAMALPTDAADDFVRHMRAEAKDRSSPLKVRPHLSYSGAVSVRIYPKDGRFLTITFAADADGGLRASHKPDADRVLTLMLHEWLAASDRFSEIG